MADIRISDYAAEYEFKKTSGPRFQEPKIKIAGSEPVRRNETVGESLDGIIQRDGRVGVRIVSSEDYRQQALSRPSFYESFGSREAHFDTRNADIGGRNTDAGVRIDNSGSDLRDSPTFPGVSNHKSDYLNWKNGIDVRNRRRRKDSGRNRNGRYTDIGRAGRGRDGKVAHLQNTINSSYSSLKETLIKATDMEEACYLWISTYEKPSEKYSTWREKAQRDIKNFKAELYDECEVGRRALSNGIFLWPCPSSHNVTSYFGNRTPPTAGATADHKAIDIGAAKGASVIAAADGKVTSVSYSNARGYFIVVDHGNGYVTLYQHLSRQDVKQGKHCEGGAADWSCRRYRHQQWTAPTF